jgi:hypothetical protein
MSITSGSTGTGSGVVTVSVTPNPTTGPRTGTLTVAGQAIPVREDGLTECTVDISPASASFDEGSDTGSFAVIAPGDCAWVGTSGAAWVRLISGAEGTGNGTVTFAVERNRDIAARTGGIAVGGRTFEVVQSGDVSGCEYSVTPIEFTPCMSVSFEMTATLTTQAGCPWTAAPDASWISVTRGRSGTGSGTIAFRVADNWDPPRHRVVMIRWPTPTAGQNLQVRQAGCFYAVTADNISMGAAAGTGQFGVVQQSEPIECGGPTQNACMWIAQADVSWITITTSMPQVGDNPVTFTVTANAGPSARTGTIRVRDKVVRVTQAGL